MSALHGYISDSPSFMFKWFVTNLGFVEVLFVWLFWVGFFCCCCCFFLFVFGFLNRVNVLWDLQTFNQVTGKMNNRLSFHRMILVLTTGHVVSCWNLMPKSFEIITWRQGPLLLRRINRHLLDQGQRIFVCACESLLCLSHFLWLLAYLKSTLGV